jgi:hypothetical protein
MKQLTAIALSGGIDSLVASHLLIESGHSVVGIHFITGSDTDTRLRPPPFTPSVRIPPGWYLKPRNRRSVRARGPYFTGMTRFWAGDGLQKVV